MNYCFTCKESSIVELGVYCESNGSHGMCCECIELFLSSTTFSDAITKHSPYELRYKCTFPECSYHYSSENFMKSSSHIVRQSFLKSFTESSISRTKDMAALTSPSPSSTSCSTSFMGEILTKFQGLISAYELNSKNSAATQSCNQKMAELIDSILHGPLADIFNLQCPHCHQVFIDYDGCDAIKCGTCKLEFCGICLAKCGEDAHDHVTTYHNAGDYYSNTEKIKKQLALQRVDKITSFMNDVTKHPLLNLLILVRSYKNLLVSFNIKPEYFVLNHRILSPLDNSSEFWRTCTSIFMKFVQYQHIADTTPTDFASSESLSTSFIPYLTYYFSFPSPKPDHDKTSPIIKSLIERLDKSYKSCSTDFLYISLLDTISLLLKHTRIHLPYCKLITSENLRLIFSSSRISVNHICTQTFVRLVSNLENSYKMYISGNNNATPWTAFIYDLWCFYFAVQKHNNELKTELIFNQDNFTLVMKNLMICIMNADESLQSSDFKIEISYLSKCTETIEYALDKMAVNNDILLMKDFYNSLWKLLIGTFTIFNHGKTTIYLRNIQLLEILSSMFLSKKLRQIQSELREAVDWVFPTMITTEFRKQILSTWFISAFSLLNPSSNNIHTNTAQEIQKLILPINTLRMIDHLHNLETMKNESLVLNFIQQNPCNTETFHACIEKITKLPSVSLSICEIMELVKEFALNSYHNQNSDALNFIINDLISKHNLIPLALDVFKNKIFNSLNNIVTNNNEVKINLSQAFNLWNDIVNIQWVYYSHFSRTSNKAPKLISNEHFLITFMSFFYISGPEQFHIGNKYIVKVAFLLFSMMMSNAEDKATIKTVVFPTINQVQTMSNYISHKQLIDNKVHLLDYIEWEQSKDQLTCLNDLFTTSNFCLCVNNLLLPRLQTYSERRMDLPTAAKISNILYIFEIISSHLLLSSQNEQGLINSIKRSITNSIFNILIHLPAQITEGSTSTLHNLPSLYYDLVTQCCFTQRNVVVVDEMSNCFDDQDHIIAKIKFFWNKFISNHPFVKFMHDSTPVLETHNKNNPENLTITIILKSFDDIFESFTVYFTLLCSALSGIRKKQQCFLDEYIEFLSISKDVFSFCELVASHNTNNLIKFTMYDLNIFSIYSSLIPSMRFFDHDKFEEYESKLLPLLLEFQFPNSSTKRLSEDLPSTLDDMLSMILQDFPNLFVSHFASSQLLHMYVDYHFKILHDDFVFANLYSLLSSEKLSSSSNFAPVLLQSYSINVHKTNALFLYHDNLDEDSDQIHENLLVNTHSLQIYQMCVSQRIHDFKAHCSVLSQDKFEHEIVNLLTLINNMLLYYTNNYNDFCTKAFYNKSISSFLWILEHLVSVLNFKSFMSEKCMHLTSYIIYSLVNNFQNQGDPHVSRTRRTYSNGITNIKCVVDSGIKLLEAFSKQRQHFFNNSNLMRILHICFENTKLLRTGSKLLHLIAKLLPQHTFLLFNFPGQNLDIFFDWMSNNNNNNYNNNEIHSDYNFNKSEFQKCQLPILLNILHQKSNNQNDIQALFDNRIIQISHVLQFLHQHVAIDSEVANNLLPKIAESLFVYFNITRGDKKVHHDSLLLLNSLVQKKWSPDSYPQLHFILSSISNNKHECNNKPQKSAFNKRKQPSKRIIKNQQKHYLLRNTRPTKKLKVTRSSPLSDITNTVY